MRQLLALSTSLLLFGSILAQETAVDFDPSTDFKQYKTFGWHPDTKLPPPYPNSNPKKADEVVRTTVDGILMSKGLARVGGGNPELWVSYMVGATFGLTSSPYDSRAPMSNPLGTGQWRPFFSNESSSSLEAMGTLTLDFIDSGTGRLVWRGSAQGAVKEPEKNRKKAEKAIRRLLKGFPPKTPQAK